MDVTFVLEESGATATVEVPCEANAAAAKEVACTAFSVSPASVEMRIGTEVVEGTCRLQDTAIGAGVQVVLASPHYADIRCPAEYNAQEGCITYVSLSRCGSLCVYTDEPSGIDLHGCRITGFDTETLRTAFSLRMQALDPPAISPCKTRCYVRGRARISMIALPGGEVLRTVLGTWYGVFICGDVVVFQGQDGASVYDADLTLLRSLSHQGCTCVAVSSCGGWVMTSSMTESNARLWDVSSGVAMACVSGEGWSDVALSRCASVFAVVQGEAVQLYDWQGTSLGSFGLQIRGNRRILQFTPCGKYLLVHVRFASFRRGGELRQYDVATKSCVRVFRDFGSSSFAISPCSRIVVYGRSKVVTRYLYPYT